LKIGRLNESSNQNLLENQGKNPIMITL